MKKLAPALLLVLMPCATMAAPDMNIIQKIRSLNIWNTRHTADTADNNTTNMIGGNWGRISHLVYNDDYIERLVNSGDADAWAGFVDGQRCADSDTPENAAATARSMTDFECYVIKCNDGFEMVDTQTAYQYSDSPIIAFDRDSGLCRGHDLCHEITISNKCK